MLRPSTHLTLFWCDGDPPLRERFIDWLDNVDWRDAGVESDSVIPFAKGANAGKKTFRKSMWDEDGQWKDSEVEPARGLRRILCRPMKHLWSESPEARARGGQV